MIPENEKYKKVINILRKSKPVLRSAEDIEREVIKRISTNRQIDFIFLDIIDFLFSWVYIKWVRLSLISVSFLLIFVFVYQQSLILKRVNYISSQSILFDREDITYRTDKIERSLMQYKLTGHKIPSESITISEKQYEQMLDSVYELQTKYRDILNLISKDPELKKYIEKKLIENNRTKIKL